MVDVNQAMIVAEDAAAPPCVALFGTGAGLRLDQRLPGVLSAEPAPAIASEALSHRYGYPGFSARTGEIGSLAGLRVLFTAALAGQPVPAWMRADGRFVDPLRPKVEPEGLASAEEVALLQQRHFAAVCRALTEAHEVVLVLGGAPYGQDRQTGAVCVDIPDMTFAPEFRDRIVPRYADMAGMDADFAEIWQMLRKVLPDIRITVALLPPMPGQTPSREEQHQLGVCCRTVLNPTLSSFRPPVLPCE